MFLVIIILEDILIIYIDIIKISLEKFLRQKQITYFYKNLINFYIGQEKLDRKNIKSFYILKHNFQIK